jgi:uncharacterized protein (TIGR02996 family)
MAAARRFSETGKAMTGQPTLTQVNKAAAWPGEEEMLAAVLADLRSDDAKWIYADWLEERGDPRGPFLREFMDAVRSKGAVALPASDKLPQAWRDLIGVTLIELLVEFRLTDRMEALLVLARPALNITTQPADDQEFPLGVSKFGGLPDLPSDVAWPTWREQPMGFLGQINLAELAGVQAHRELPPQGLLSFFHYDNPDEFDFFIDHPEQPWWRVVYTPATERLRRRRPPRPLRQGNAIALECALTFDEMLDLPDSSSARIEGKPRSRYLELLSHLEKLGHHLLGYALASPYEPMAGNWRHLMTFAADENLGWDWEHGDRLFYYIRDADLRRRKFEATSLQHT